MKIFYRFVILDCEGFFSCVDGFCMDGFTAEEIENFSHEENFFTQNQICDGNIACPATEFDEWGCNPSPNPEP